MKSISIKNAVQLFYSDLKIVLKKEKLLLTDITENLVLNIKKLGIKIYLTQMIDPDISGMLIFEPNENVETNNEFYSPTIYLNRDDSLERQRFTIMHEIGHLYMHAFWSIDSSSANIEYKEIYYRNGELDEKELEANNFAASILMPKTNFIEDYEAGNGIIKLSKKYNVSRSAVAIRLENILKNHV